MSEIDALLPPEFWHCQNLVFWDDLAGSFFKELTNIKVFVSVDTLE